MRTTRFIKAAALCLLTLARAPQVEAQNALFTYQGRLTDNGTNFSGTGQFQFALVTSTNLSHTATATAVVSLPFVTGYNITAAGSGYISPPTVTVTGGGGSGATATATISGGSVNAINPGSAGTGYTSTPTVTLSPAPANIIYTSYWSNDGTSVSGSEPAVAVSATVSNGFFTIVLGDTNIVNMSAIPASVINAQSNLQLRVWFNDGASGFAVLNPAQNLTPVPYAVVAQTANGLSGSLPVNQLSGVIGGGNLPASPSFSGTVNAGGFSGSGVGLNNVNAATLNNLSASALWQLGGNSPAAGAFLGTLNGQPLELRASNQRGWLLATNGSDSPNLTGGSVVNYIDPGVIGAVIAGGGTTNTTGYIQYGVNYANSSSNHISGNFGFIGGGTGNYAQGDHPGIVGGVNNTIQGSSYQCFIGGGINNTIQAGSYYGTEQDFIGGGYGNTLSNDTYSCFIGAGQGNSMAYGSWASSVVAGMNNKMDGYSYCGVIGGGWGNFIGYGAYASCIGGGSNNVVSDNCATVPGGYNNTAGGTFSFAAGNQAKANHTGAFVWSDSLGVPFASTGNDQFLVRATGGVGINTTNPGGASLYVSGNRTNGWANSAAWCVNTNVTTNAAPALRVAVNPANLAGMRTPDGALSVSIGAAANTPNSLIAEFGNAVGFVVSITNDGTIYSKGLALTSDRNVKTNFQELDAKAVLAKVVAMPVTQWNYTEDSADKRHIGPVAQDFSAAFALNGGDDKHISVVDEAGVALAAIQGLNHRLQDEVKTKDAQIASLQSRMEALEAALARWSGPPN